MNIIASASMNERKVKNKITVVAFLVTPLLLVLIFVFIPMVIMLRNSFYSMSLTKEYGFVGLENYATIFATEKYINSLLTGAYYVIASILQVFFALVLAVIVDRIKHNSIIKGILFFPYMINGIAVGYIFILFFTHGFVLDRVITFLGVNPENIPYWLRNQNINNFALAMVSVWRYSGMSFVIFLGALSSINLKYYQIATLEGCGHLHIFKYIVWPNIRQVVFFNLLLSCVSSLSEFEIPYAVTGGANGTATYMIMI